MFQINAITRNGATGKIKVQMTIPAGSTNCSNTVSTNYNGTWATNAACNTVLNVPSLNNGTTSASDQFNYI